jgi:uncharacterized protein (DUF2141 family)
MAGRVDASPRRRLHDLIPSSILVGITCVLRARPNRVSMLRRFTPFLVIVLLTRYLPSGAESPAPDKESKTSSGCTLRIHVDGLRNSNGVVGSVVFRSPDGWPEDPKKAFRRGPTPITPGQRQATVVWENLPPGDYGVAAIHDENRNARLDRNLIGIPKEGFGFANNPHVGLSAPAFKLAVVHVQCPATETTIHLQYR